MSARKKRRDDAERRPPNAHELDEQLSALARSYERLAKGIGNEAVAPGQEGLARERKHRAVATARVLHGLTRALARFPFEPKALRELELAAKSGDPFSGAQQKLVAFVNRCLDEHRDAEYVGEGLIHYFLFAPSTSGVTLATIDAQEANDPTRRAVYKAVRRVLDSRDPERIIRAALRAGGVPEKQAKAFFDGPRKRQERTDARTADKS